MSRLTDTLESAVGASIDEARAELRAPGAGAAERQVAATRAQAHALLAFVHEIELVRVEFRELSTWYQERNP